MSRAVKPPTEQIRRVANLFDLALSFLVSSWSSAPCIGKYEADVECWNLLKLILRHVDSVITLARTDLVLLPSAMVLARSAFETSAKTVWMLAPENPFEREVRWLAHLQSEEEFHRKAADHYDKRGLSELVARIRNVEATIRNFRSQFTAKLPEGYRPLAKVPNVFEMLESFDNPEKYIFYVWGCQYAHGTHKATGLYRKNLGTKKEIGEFIEMGDWYFCLCVCWTSLSAGTLFLERIGGDPRTFLTNEFSETVRVALEQIKDADDQV